MWQRGFGKFSDVILWRNEARRYNGPSVEEEIMILEGQPFFWTLGKPGALGSTPSCIHVYI